MSVFCDGFGYTGNVGSALLAGPVPSANVWSGRRLTAHGHGFSPKGPPSELCPPPTTTCRPWHEPESPPPTGSLATGTAESQDTLRAGKAQGRGPALVEGRDAALE